MGVKSSTPSSSQPTLEVFLHLYYPPTSLPTTRAGNIMAIAISQAIADVGPCFVLPFQLRLTLRVPYSPLSSHIIFSPPIFEPLSSSSLPLWGALLALLQGGVPYYPRRC